MGSELSFDLNGPFCSSVVTGTVLAVKTASLRLPRRSARRLLTLPAKACLTAQVRLLLVLEDSAQGGRCVLGTQACFTSVTAASLHLPCGVEVLLSVRHTVRVLQTCLLPDSSPSSLPLLSSLSQASLLLC